MITDQINEHFFLMSARIESLGLADPATVPPIVGVDYGAWTTVGIGDIRLLFGKLAPTPTEVNLKMGGWPKAERLKHIYVLGRKIPGHGLEIASWNYVVQGLCIDHKFAEQYHLTAELIKLKDEKKIKWDCDW